MIQSRSRSVTPPISGLSVSRKSGSGGPRLLRGVVLPWSLKCDEQAIELEEVTDTTERASGTRSGGSRVGMAVYAGGWHAALLHRCYGGLCTKETQWVRTCMFSEDAEGQLTMISDLGGIHDTEGRWRRTRRGNSRVQVAAHASARSRARSLRRVANFVKASDGSIVMVSDHSAAVKLDRGYGGLCAKETQKIKTWMLLADVKGTLTVISDHDERAVNALDVIRDAAKRARGMRRGTFVETEMIRDRVGVRRRFDDGMLDRLHIDICTKETQ